VFDLACFSSELHDLAAAQQKLIAKAVLSDWNIRFCHLRIEPIEGKLSFPGRPQRMPHWAETSATDVKSTSLEDEAILVLQGVQYAFR
jgi:hypothetical protein